ncbi:hypothetical protein BDV23DRAFT_162109 [Aspergillus alliaceus]|uniref:Uncharacterized protein n=1 Tax=Petromyces alliaceus TaxID=209559 RepID=A0A5N7BZB7_PETAA|nr:hypothetical protein BDV23DRAFT_162109 [Aspergillus alliaceus]
MFNPYSCRDTVFARLPFTTSYHLLFYRVIADGRWLSLPGLRAKQRTTGCIAYSMAT